MGWITHWRCLSLLWLWRMLDPSCLHCEGWDRWLPSCSSGISFGRISPASVGVNYDMFLLNLLIFYYVCTVWIRWELWYELWWDVAFSPFKRKQKHFFPIPLYSSWIVSKPNKSMALVMHWHLPGLHLCKKNPCSHLSLIWSLSSPPGRRMADGCEGVWLDPAQGTWPMPRGFPWEFHRTGAVKVQAHQLHFCWKKASFLVDN